MSVFFFLLKFTKEGFLTILLGDKNFFEGGVANGFIIESLI
jgi:hypothetical protein